MKNYIRRRNHAKKGFTLVELVIVIAVLAILAAIALPLVGNVIGSANEAADASNARMMTNAIALSAANLGSSSGYPGNAADAITAILHYTDLTEMPACKQSGFNYYYSPTTYQVRALSGAQSAGEWVMLK